MGEEESGDERVGRCGVEKSILNIGIVDNISSVMMLCDVRLE